MEREDVENRHPQEEEDVQEAGRDDERPRPDQAAFDAPRIRAVAVPPVTPDTEDKKRRLEDAKALCQSLKIVTGRRKFDQSFCFFFFMQRHHL